MGYNGLMRVWRGFTLTVWVILLVLLAAFAMQYRALQATVLDGNTAKTQLAQTGSYETFRDTVLLEKLRAIVQARYPQNTLIDDAMLRSILAETLPQEEMRRRFEPAVDSVYRWIDSKEPEISFSVDLSDKASVFYRVLEVQLGKKLASLPSCGDYRYPPDEAVLVDKCIPVYIAVTEATGAAMDTLRSNELPIGNVITPETFAAPSGQAKSLRQLPTYLNYLWVLNYVALALFVLISLFLLVTRRSLGVAAIGISLIGASVTVWVTQPAIRRLIPQETEGVFRLISEIAETLFAAFTATGSRYALVSLLVGICVTASAIGWRWWRKKRHHA